MTERKVVQMSIITTMQLKKSGEVAMQDIKLYATLLWNVQDNRIRLYSVYYYVPLMGLAALGKKIDISAYGLDIYYLSKGCFAH